MTQDDEGLATLQVQWSPVDCIHQNGELTGYKVCHTSLATTTELCTTTPDLSLNISVDSGMNYSVRVAAVNNEGVGPYSNDVVVKVTLQGIYATTSSYYFTLELVVFNKSYCTYIILCY